MAFFSQGFGGFEGFEEAFGGRMGGGPSRSNEPVDNEGLYKLLGVSKDVNKSQLKKAFFKLARKKHPDKGGDPKEFQEINQAYDILKDDDKRAVYDKYGMEGIKEGRGKGGGGDMGDIFGQMFGGMGGQRKEKRQRKAKGMLKEMEVTLEEVYNGGMKKFRHERYRLCEACDGAGGEGVETCGKCKGKGRVMKMIQLGPGMYQQAIQTCQACNGEGQTIKMKCKVCKGQKIVNKETKIEVPVEKGIPDQHDYVMTGEAHEAPGVMAGDLHVRFSIKKHKVFTRKGADLFMTKKISLLEALTGFTFEFSHLDGRTVKVATMPGEVIGHKQSKMLRNFGMPFFQDEMGSGNLFIEFDVQFPKKGSLKPKQIKSLRKILPGPMTTDIDYKANKFEILDEFDTTDYNPKETGGRRSHREEEQESMGGQGQRVQCQQQ